VPPLKTILFFALFVLCVAGGVFVPMLGALGYVGHYTIGPEKQWWHAPVSGLGIRYSYTLALITAVGVLLNWKKLKIADLGIHRQELLLLLFLGLVWLSVWIGPRTVGRYTQPGIDHPSIKFTKVVIFTLIMTRIFSTRANLDKLFWVLVVASLLLGLQAWDTPRYAFSRGRLEGIGGPDFAESNFFAVFMATMLPIIGVMFLRSGWIGKTLCFVSGAFTANAVVLTRSRGAFVGIIVGGMVAAILAPKRLRWPVVLLLIVGAAGSYYLSDPQFRERMTTITKEEGERDSSAESRFRLTEAGIRMMKDNPLGIGVGNFYQTIGKYIPEYAGKDAHNTYLRCGTEMGVMGLAVLGVIIVWNFLLLRNISRRSRNLPEEEAKTFLLMSYATTMSLVILLVSSASVSLTYVEFYWWIMLLPVCLDRALDQRLAERKTLAKTPEASA
jgi:O-antigen ligase